MAERSARWLTICIAAVAAVLMSPAAEAQGPLVITPLLPAPQDGVYAVGDEPSFMIDHASGMTRLRFSGSDEVFYLSSEPSTLGGRVLKYDTGTMALTVSGWGGVTFFSANAPAGVPAERIGEVVPVDPPPVSSHDAKYFAAALSQRLADRENLAIGFAARWEWLSNEDTARNLATDAMRNAAYAIEQLANSRSAKDLLVAKLRVVRIVAGSKRSVAVQGDTLVVTFAQAGGPDARPSSLAIFNAINGKF